MLGSGFRILERIRWSRQVGSRGDQAPGVGRRVVGLCCGLLGGVASVACSLDSGDVRDLLDELGELSEAQDSFDDRLMVLGEANLDGGGRKIYVQGVSGGRALSREQLARLQVWVGGELVHGCLVTEPPGGADSGALEAGALEAGTLDAGTGVVDAGEHVTGEGDAGAPGEGDTAGDASVTEAGAPDRAASSVPEAGAAGEAKESVDAAATEVTDAGLQQCTPPPTEASGERCEVLAGLEIRTLAELDAEVFSFAIINDYSGSMRDSDLELVAEIHDDLFRLLPPVYEAEVTYFGTDVETILPFTSDREAVRAAVQADAEYERTMTALYDGMGAGLEALVERELPVRILMVSSDGRENASERWSKTELQRTIEEHGVITVMLGSNFADVGEMRDFTRDTGVFFYTPALAELTDRVGEYVDSLLDAVEIELPAELDGEPVELRVGELTATP